MSEQLFPGTIVRPKEVGSSWKVAEVIRITPHSCLVRVLSPEDFIGHTPSLDHKGWFVNPAYFEVVKTRQMPVLGKLLEVVCDEV